MGRGRVAGLVVVALALGAAAPAGAQGEAACRPPCRRGFVCQDGGCVSACNPPCPSGQVCVDNDCVDQAPASAPVAPPAPAPCLPCPSAPGRVAPAPGDFAFTRGYLSLAAAVVVQSWGRLHGYEWSDGVWGGVHLGGYWVPRPFLHVGAYLSYVGGDSRSSRLFGAGLSARYLARLAERLYLGPALDVGLGIRHAGDNTVHYGLELFPRAHFEVVLAGVRDGVKVSAWTALGGAIVPYFDRDRDWTAHVQLLIGVSVGR